VRRVLAGLALALSLIGCGLARVPAPPGEPVELGHLAETDSCKSGTIEGTLTERKPGITRIDLEPGFAWPSLPINAGAGTRYPDTSDVTVLWPHDFTGVRLANGGLAVADASGGLVALTGQTYQLEGCWVFVWHSFLPPYDYTEITGFRANDARPG